jgi:1-aminocyclopropane-1-carboxylate deaminase/D-cysteine desulfhydrase-like pyridoxal-dependent ACC family enzyme
MLDHVRRGLVRRGATVVFIHTGGQPALFSQSHALVEYLNGPMGRSEP